MYPVISSELCTHTHKPERTSTHVSSVRPYSKFRWDSSPLDHFFAKNIPSRLLSSTGRAVSSPHSLSHDRKGSIIFELSVSWIVFQCVLIFVLDAGFKSYLSSFSRCSLLTYHSRFLSRLCPPLLCLIPLWCRPGFLSRWITQYLCIFEAQVALPFRV